MTGAIDVLDLLKPADIERYWPKVNRAGDEECWLWNAPLNPSHYGTFTFAGTSTNAHRVAYRLLVGKIPPGLFLDHLCRVRHCVNPRHMEPVTCLENRRRSLPTVCLYGHELTPENTFTYPTSRRRGCITCRRKRNREGMRRRRARDAA